MDKLAPKLIRRASKKNYIAIVIDPIYKVITGDENSADQMAHFCNQFDKVCTELGCAVIYCHHHSKGGQGAKKSMDRASGSGVFARDPDALLDLIELESTDGLMNQQKNETVCNKCIDWLTRFNHIKHASQDDMCSASRMLELCSQYLQPNSLELMHEELAALDIGVTSKTAWRIEGTLREFPKFSPVDLWFDYPVHRLDTAGILKDIQPEGDYKPPWIKAQKARKEKAKKQRENKSELFNDVYSKLSDNGLNPTMQELATALGKPINTVRGWAKNAGYKVDKNTGYVISEIEN